MAGPSAIRAGRAFVELFADDSMLIRTLRRAEARVVKFGENIKAIGRRLATLGMAAGVPFAASMKVFASFDDQMRAVKAVTGATGKEFEDLTEKAKFLGRTTSFTASQVASAMLELGRAGFAPKEIDEAIPSILNLARATGTELATSAEICANTLRSFELPASEMVRVSDVMVAAANNSAQTLEDLGESMSYCAPIASEYGLSLEQTAKALGSLANYGIKGSQAGTTLRRVLTNLADPKIQKKLQGIGVAVVDQNTGKMREVSEVLRDVGAATQSMSKDQKLGFFKQLFGLYAIAGGAKLTVAQFDKLNEAVDNAAGTGAKAAKEMDAGIGGSLRMMWSAVEGVAIAVGEALAPSLKKLTDWFTNICSGIADYLTGNKQLVVQAAKVVAAVLGIGLGLFTLGSVIVGLGTALGIAATAITTIASVLTALLSPLGLVVAAVAIIGVACIRAFGQAAVAVDRLREQFGNLLSFASETVGAIAAALGRGDIEAAIGVVWATIKLIWTQGTTSLMGAWDRLVETLATAWATCVYKISETLTKAWYGVREFWAETIYTMSTLWTGFADHVITQWKRAEKAYAKGFAVMIAKAQGLDVQEVLGNVDAAYGAQADRRERAKTARLNEIQAERDEKIGALQTEKQGVLDTLKADHNRDDGSYRARLDAREAELAKARAAYDEAIRRARNPEASRQSGPSVADKLPTQVRDALRNFSATGLGEGGRSRGTFSAFEIGALSDDIPKEQLDELRNQTALLRNLRFRGIPWKED